MRINRHCTALAASLVILVGLLCLVGWFADIELLKAVYPGFPQMKANAGVCFVLSGISLLLQAGAAPQGRRRQVLIRAVSLAAMGIGGLTLLEYSFEWELGIDQLLVHEPSSALARFPAGRMSPAAAISFLLLNLLLLKLHTGNRWLRHVSSGVFLLVVSVGTLLSSLGWFYSAGTMHSLPIFSTMALPAVVGFWLLCLGIISAQPTTGALKLFGSESVLGILPCAVLVPVLVGWAKYKGEQAGLPELSFGTVLNASTLLVVFAILLGWAGSALNRAYAQHKRGEDALRRSNARLDAMISSALDAVISMDGQGRIVLFNPAAERMFEVTASKVLGERMDLLNPQLYEDTQRVYQEQLRSGNENIPASSAGSFSAVRSSGTIFPVEASMSRVEVEGEQLFTVILRDITERQKSQEQLRALQQREHARVVELEALLEAIPAPVWFSKDPDCLQMTGNRAALEVLGAKPGQNLSRSAPASERLPFEVRRNNQLLEPHQLPMQIATASGQPVIGSELEICRADGTVRSLYGNAMPLLDEKGRVRGCVGVMVDITESKQAREELRALALRLQAVREEERTRIAREIHDVLAQELTAIKLQVAWLKRRLSEPFSEEKQQLLLAKIPAILELTDGAIQCVKKIATELRPIILDTLELSAAIEWLAKDFEERTNIQCQARLTDEELELDKQQSTALFRILQESLTNVVRHAAAKQVVIELERQDRMIRLAVQDDGRGIPENCLGDPKSLGLVGMRERASLLGGECRFTSKSGVGTMVEVRFPALTSIEMAQV